ncbi:MAG: hypothetical protein RIC14_05635 [Filomicrobium sp.]
MAYKIKALKEGRWRDGALGVEHDVKPGDVVPFQEAQDAAFFADGVVGEWYTDRPEPEPKPAPKPKKSKAKAKGSDDAQEATE